MKIIHENDIQEAIQKAQKSNKQAMIFWALALICFVLALICQIIGI